MVNVSDKLNHMGIRDQVRDQCHEWAKSGQKYTHFESVRGYFVFYMKWSGYPQNESQDSTSVLFFFRRKAQSE